MKKNHIHIATIFNLLGALAYLFWPLATYAETPTIGTVLPPIVISEVQMGSTASASEEFIELYNASSVPIELDAHNWRLEVAGSSASGWASPLRTIALSKTLQPGKSYVVASQYTSAGGRVQYLPGATDVSFSAGLSYTAGHIRLLYDTNQLTSSNVCSASSTIVDEVEWTTPKSGGTATHSLDARQQYVSEKTSGVGAEVSLQRQTDIATNRYIDTDNDAVDFIAGAPSPGAVNDAAIPHSMSGAQPQVELPVDTCDPTPPTGSVDDDEPDDSEGSESPTSNSGADESDTSGDEASDGTNESPSPATVNIGLLSPSITELLPNPASPQTDAADEFIELYNPNQSVFDLGGYRLQVGTTTTRTYTFPVGTRLEPRSYTAFFSASTGLSLSNSGGQAKLFDASGAVLSASEPYDAAKDSQAWAVIDNTWRWTLTPTPNASNKLAAVASATATKTATAKKAAVKGKTAAAAKAKTKTAKAPKPKANSSNTAFVADAPVARLPVHPAVLAVIGVAAVLYGAYEYRQDVANYFRRLRENRTAGRKNRQAAEGRGND